MRKSTIIPTLVLTLYAGSLARAGVVEIMPPGEKLRKDRPRLLVRAKADPHAISVEQLKALKQDADYQAAMRTLKSRNNAACMALIWMLTGDEAAADRAFARLEAFKRGPSDAFDVFFGLRELALAYDWLYDHPKFTPELKKKVRDKAFVLCDKWGVPKGDDHVFHNYTWMNNCGMALWAMACYGDDPRAEKLMETVRLRLNGRMFPAMEHLSGMAGDAMGYWFIYCPATCIWALMAVQSAYGIDVATPIRKEQDDWLNRQLEGSMHGTMPNMRFMPWGDIQSGPDGGVTHEWAGLADAATWATKNPQGAFFRDWLAERRGMNRFHGETVMLYFLYTRHITAAPEEPPLAMLAGREHSAQAMMRSSWKDDATVVGFKCTDYHQGHFHHDAGSFVIYRDGLLAVDAGRYTKYTRSLRAPMIATSAHNSLLLGGEGQRVVEGQWYKDLAEFNAAREDKRDGRRLECGDVPFYRHAGEWTAVSGQFAQAYKPGVVKSCVRQLLYVRPNTLIVVDNLVPADGKKLPEVRWVINVPKEKMESGPGMVGAANEKSWLRCRSLTSQDAPVIENSPPTQLTADYKKHTEIARANFAYKDAPGELTLVHVIDVGDGTPGKLAEVKPEITAEAIEVSLNGKTFVFSKKAPFAVEAR